MPHCLAHAHSQFRDDLDALEGLRRQVQLSPAYFQEQQLRIAKNSRQRIVHGAGEKRLALQQSLRVAKDGRQGIAQLVRDCLRNSTTKKKRTGGLSRPFFLIRFV